MRLLLIALLLLPVAHAVEYDYVLLVNFSDDPQGIVADVQSVRVMERSADRLPPGDVFEVRLLAGTRQIASKDIYIALVGETRDEDLYAGDVPLEYIVTEVQLPYDPTADSVEFISAAGTFTFRIADYICRADGVCRDGENRVTCAADCPVGSDGICDARIDGSCDPDCAGKDPDCGRQQIPQPGRPNITPPGGPVGPTPSGPNPPNPTDVQPDETGYGWLQAIALIVLVTLVMLIWYRRRHAEG